MSISSSHIPSEPIGEGGGGGKVMPTLEAASSGLSNIPGGSEDRGDAGAKLIRSPKSS